MSLLSRTKQIFEFVVKFGFCRNLGHLRITEAQKEFVKAKMVVLESDCSPAGILHGGQISNIVDNISSLASEMQISWCVC